ncbi:helix-turn-helix transcriptional regulator [Dactylosporangium sp. CA-152071]|uniref:helix-turn-helix transcriptional regulator n=1 Tax=Dactylosporangium sp. CA-152071 TaxID=3239933 RepID=UPI003D92ED4E
MMAPRVRAVSVDSGRHDGGFMSLVDRDIEMSQLRQWLAESIQGNGRVVLIKGPVASGKSELLRALAEQSAADGMLILGAWARSSERHVPLSVLRQLLRHLPDGGQMWPAARPDGAPATSGEHLATGPAWLFDTVPDACSLLVEHAAERPILVLVDDVQHADPASLDHLLRLIRQIRQARLMIVFTEAEHSPWELGALHTELLRQPYCRGLRLRVLSPDGVGRVLAAHSIAATDELVESFHNASGGNPLLLRALAQDFARPAPAAGRNPVGAVIGHAFGRAFLTCLHDSGPSAVRVARGLAVLDAAASPALLSELIELDPAEVRRVCDELETAGLLAAGAFRHAEAQAVVLDEMSEPERQELRRRAAELLHAKGASVSVVARLLIASYHAGSPWALSVLHEAAEHALNQDEPALAVRCLQLARDSCTNEKQRVAITAMLAQAEWRTNPFAVVQYLGELSAALRAGHLGPRAAVSLARYQLWHGRLDDAAEALRSVEATAVTLDKATSGMFRAALDVLRCWVPPAAEAATAGAGRGGGTGPRARPGGVLGAVLTYGAEHTGPEAERFLRSVRLDDESVDLVQAALLALVYAGALDQAARWCSALLREAARRDAPTWMGLLAAVSAEISLRKGNLPSARQDADFALRQFPMRSWGTGIGIPLAGSVLATSTMGRYAEADGLLAQPVNGAALASHAGMHYLHARGRHLLATDRLGAALDDFMACGEFMRKQDLNNPGLVPWQSSAAEVFLRWGDLTRSRKLIEEQLAQPGGNVGRPRGLALRQLAAVHVLPKRSALLRKSIEALHSCGDRVELARALSDLGQAHHDLGEFDQARAVRAQALEYATECCVEPLRDALVGADPRPGGDGAIALLSEAERRVVALASEGDKNREIARKLYITVSTVEQHLTSAYRKLNVRRRTELPRNVCLDCASSA